MAESSLWWTTGSTGDGATAYTQAQCILWLHKTFCGADNEGVNKDVDNELAGTGTSSPVAINTGEAYVRGFPYFNTASVDVAVPTPSGNTRIDRIVLRAGWAAQTVRITRIAGTEGLGTPPALVQTDGTTWDIPLCQASITTGGVITLTDEREFIHPNIAVDEDMLDASVAGDGLAGGDGSVLSVNVDDSTIEISSDTLRVKDAGITTAKMATDSVDDTRAGNRVPQFYRRQGASTGDAWDNYGTTNHTPGAVRMQGGAISVTINNGTNNASVEVTFPVAFSAGPLLSATVSDEGGSLPANNHLVLVARPKSLSETTTAEILVYTSAGGNATSHNLVQIHWLAVGPE